MGVDVAVAVPALGSMVGVGVIVGVINCETIVHVGTLVRVGESSMVWVGVQVEGSRMMVAVGVGVL